MLRKHENCNVSLVQHYFSHILRPRGFLLTSFLVYSASRGSSVKVPPLRPKFPRLGGVFSLVNSHIFFLQNGLGGPFRSPDGFEPSTPAYSKNMKMAILGWFSHTFCFPRVFRKHEDSTFSLIQQYFLLSEGASKA